MHHSGLLPFLGVWNTVLGVKTSKMGVTEKPSWLFFFRWVVVIERLFKPKIDTFSNTFIHDFTFARFHYVKFQNVLSIRNVRYFFQISNYFFLV